MQKIAAYLLERREGMEQPDRRAAEVEAIRGRLEEWLRSKGATELGPAGTYDAQDGSRATFAIEEATDDGRSWWLVRLQELNEHGRRFAVAISVTSVPGLVAVYGSLEIGSGSTVINAVDTDAECPEVIRTLLEMPGAWFHGPSRLYTLRRVASFEEGGRIAAELLDPDRTVPVVVVSEGEQGVSLPDLHVKLARDLAGLANVVVAEEDATWAISDGLGPDLACYSGAVRLYWPKLTVKDVPYRHQLWKAERLRSPLGSPMETLHRFRRQVRGMVMRASAWGVVRPRQIDEIRADLARRTLAEMKAKARSLQDYMELADSYARHNDQLEAQLAAVEDERDALLLRAQNAEAQLKYRAPDPREIAPEPQEERTRQDPVPPPGRGDERFYKKHYDAPMHDIMLRVGDCGHNSWENAHSADKARKGIARLEGGRNDWKTVQHCASCTGGGMWRVRW